ncbi:MAG: hypothetical protein FWD68_00510 [Alphaproteobacteria bacterium]|nr:hypothetical protein [Alphaproteobacteria bacterium]
MPQTLQNSPLTTPDSGPATAFSLMQRCLPRAMMRFVILFAWSPATFLWLVVTIGGALWSAAHVAANMVRGIVGTINGIVEGIRSFLPIPGLDTVAQLLSIVTRGDTSPRQGDPFLRHGPGDGNPWEARIARTLSRRLAFTPSFRSASQEVPQPSLA